MPDYLSFIWNIEPEAFNIIGLLSIHWSTLLTGIGLLISFEYYLYQTKRFDAPFKSSVGFFVLALLGAILGAKIVDILLSEIPAAEQIEEFSFSLYGGIISVVIISLFTFKKQPRLQLKVLDTAVATALLLLIFIQIGVFLDANLWGKPTNSSKGVVFTSESSALFEGIFDKISQVHVTENSEVKEEQNALPLNLKIHFIAEIKDKQEIGHFLNADFKNSLVHNPSLNAHFKSHLPDQLAFKLEENNNKIIAHVHVNGIPRHPISIYKALVTFIIFILIVTMGKKGRLKYAGAKSTFIMVALIVSYLAIDFFFAIDFKWQVFSELLLAFMLLVIAIWLMVKIRKTSIYKNQRLV